MSKKSPFNNIVRFVVKRTFVFLLVLSFSLIGAVPGARGMDNTLYVKPEATGTGDCSTWGNACTLQTALTNTVSGDQIWVVAGTYKPGPAHSARWVTFQLNEGVAVYGGFNGTETSLGQRDWTINMVTLSGDLNSDDVGFTNNGEEQLPCSNWRHWCHPGWGDNQWR